MLARLFGCNMKDGSIAKISDNRFARADLEHIHLLVDDDMKMEALPTIKENTRRINISALSSPLVEEYLSIILAHHS